MKLRTRLGLLEESPDESADDGTHDADDGGCDEAHLVRPGHHRTCDESDNEPDDDEPYDVEHGSPPFGFVVRVTPQNPRGWPCRRSRSRMPTPQARGTWEIRR